MYYPESEISPVSEFTAATNRIEELLEYPGPRPPASFLTDGEMVTLLPTSFDQFADTVDAQLAASGLPLISERIPVLAYGANANPVRLAKKMKKYGSEAQPLLQTVPHCTASIPDMVAVWHGEPGQTGSAFAELYNAPAVQGAKLKAHLAFLTVEQVGVLHQSEGGTYSAAEIQANVGSEDQPEAMQAIAYVALKSTVLFKGDSPIMVKELVQTGSRLPRLTAQQAVRYMLRSYNLGNGDSIRENPATFVAQGLELNLEDKKARQAKIQGALSKMGISREFRFVDPSNPAEAATLIGRADFASLPGQDPQVLRTPEMVLGKIRPTESDIGARMADLAALNPGADTMRLKREAIRSVQDVARSVSSRALVELSVRTGYKIIKKTT